jgi:hypothetical protein
MKISIFQVEIFEYWGEQFILEFIHKYNGRESINIRKSEDSIFLEGCLCAIPSSQVPN